MRFLRIKEQVIPVKLITHMELDKTEKRWEEYQSYAETSETYKEKRYANMYLTIHYKFVERDTYRAAQVDLEFPDYKTADSYLNNLLDKLNGEVQ